MQASIVSTHECITLCHLCVQHGNCSLDWRTCLLLLFYATLPRQSRWVGACAPFMLWCRTFDFECACPGEFSWRQCKSVLCKSVQSASALACSVCHCVPGMFPNGSVSPFSVSPFSRHQALVSSVRCLVCKTAQLAVCFLLQPT